MRERQFFQMTLDNKVRDGEIKIAKSKNVSGAFYPSLNITLGLRAPEESIENIITHEIIHRVLFISIGAKASKQFDIVCRKDVDSHRLYDSFLY